MTLREYTTAKGTIHRATNILKAMGEVRAAERLWQAWGRGVRKYMGMTAKGKIRKKGSRTHLKLGLKR